MKIRQLSVFLENKVGELSKVCRILANNNINIIASNLADTSDFGIFRMVVNSPEDAKKLLKESGFTVLENNVVALDIEDKPGGLADVLELLEKNKINIEYLYVLARRKPGQITFIFRFKETDKAISLLLENSVKVYKYIEIISPSE